MPYSGFILFMHLSMSSPTYPRSGRGGDWWGFAKFHRKMPLPWGQLPTTNPLLIPTVQGGISRGFDCQV